MTDKGRGSMGPDNDPVFNYVGMTTLPKGIKCPNCGSKRKVLPIFYGMPEVEAVKLYRKGRIHIAGCSLPDGEPNLYHCDKCEHEWF